MSVTKALCERAQYRVERGVDSILSYINSIYYYSYYINSKFMRYVTVYGNDTNPNGYISVKIGRK